MQNSTCLGIDWLQINCNKFPTLKQGIKFDYTIKDTNLSTRQYKKIHQIWQNETLICDVCSEPFSNIIPTGSHLIKFNNKILYNYNYENIIQSLFTTFEFKYNHVSRIDFFIDFNTFAYNLKPEKLIKNFCNEKYIHLGKTKFSIYGNEGKNIKFQYLRFGSRLSTVCIYLYNKTKEMQEKIYKPYIKENWKNNKIDTRKDVWRLEFSIINPKFTFINKDTAEIINMNGQEIYNKKNSAAIIETLIEKYFTWKYKKKYTNISRLKNILLFRNLDNSIKLIIDHTKLNSDKYIRQVIKKIHELNTEIREKKHINEPTIHDLLEYWTFTRDQKIIEK